MGIMERNQRVIFCLSSEEKTLLQSLAEYEKQNLSSFIREHLLKEILDLHMGQNHLEKVVKMQRRALLCLKKLLEKNFTTEQLEEFWQEVKKIE